MSKGHRESRAIWPIVTSAANLVHPPILPGPGWKMPPAFEKRASIDPLCLPYRSTAVRPKHIRPRHHPSLILQELGQGRPKPPPPNQQGCFFPISTRTCSLNPSIPPPPRRSPPPPPLSSLYIRCDLVAVPDVTSASAPVAPITVNSRQRTSAGSPIPNSAKKSGSCKARRFNSAPSFPSKRDDTACSGGWLRSGGQLD